MYKSVAGAQHCQVEIGSVSVVDPPILVKEDCKCLQLGKDSEISVRMSMKFGDREV